MKVKVSELRLGDTVKLFDGYWCYGIVRQIEKHADNNGIVKIFRPYGTCADYSYTGGVICYVGVEECTRQLTDTYPIEVVQRKILKDNRLELWG